MSEHDNHGNTPAAWTGVGIWCLTSVVAAILLVTTDVLVFAIVAVVGLIVGAVVWKLMAAAAARKTPDAGVVTTGT